MAEFWITHDKDADEIRYEAVGAPDERVGFNFALMALGVRSELVIEVQGGFLVCFSGITAPATGLQVLRSWESRQADGAVLREETWRVVA